MINKIPGKIAQGDCPLKRYGVLDALRLDISSVNLTLDVHS